VDAPLLPPPEVARALGMPWAVGVPLGEGRKRTSILLVNPTGKPISATTESPRVSRSLKCASPHISPTFCCDRGDARTAAFLPAAPPRDTRSTRRVVGPSGPSRRQATAWAATRFEHANFHAGPCGASDLSVRPPCGRCARSLPAPWSKRRADKHLRSLPTKAVRNAGWSEICEVSKESCRVSISSRIRSIERYGCLVKGCGI